MSKADRIKGALYGAAIGDALGAPYEFDNPPMPEPFTYLEHHDFWQNSPATGDWTDDTAQLLGIIRARATVTSLEDFPKAFAKELVHWFQTDGRGCGVLTNRILSDVAFPSLPLEVAKDAWEESGRNSAPNGAVMRTAGAVLATFLRSPADILRLTKLACQVTHADPRCLASCLAVNLLLTNLILAGGTGNLDRCTEIALTYVPPEDRHWFQATLKELALDRDGIGYTYKCAGAGFWAIRELRNRPTGSDAFRTILRDLIRAGGDTDTNAAVAGALLGGTIGFSQIPKDLIEGLKRKEELEAALALSLGSQQSSNPCTGGV